MRSELMNETSERIYCNECKGKTLHRIVGAAQNGGTDEETGYWWSTVFEMLQCAGCQEIRLRRTFKFSENSHDEVSYFPPATSRYPPNWRTELPNEMRLLLEEVYRSLDSESLGLAMMGARALVDMLILDKVGDVGNFKEKLNALVKAGLLSSHNEEVLFAALDLGNAAAHRGHRAAPSEVEAVMDVVENMFQAVYIFPDLAKKLRKSTPRRSPRIKSALNIGT